MQRYNAAGLKLPLPAGGGGLTNINISAGTTSKNLSNIIFGNANGITFGLDAALNQITASHNGITLQTVQPVAISGSNGSFAFSTVTFGNLNGLSFYTSNGSMVGSYTVPSQTVQPVAVSGSNGSFAFSTVTFGNLNGISFYTSNGSMVASHNGLTSQSNQALSGSNGSFTFQTATFGNLNGFSFYTSNGSLVGSYTVPSFVQSVQTLGIYAVGNTLGASSSSTYDARSLSIDFQGVISGGWTNGSLRLSVPAGGGGLTNINISAGTTSQNLSNLVFSNSNGVSFGLNGSTITASAAGGGGGGFTAPGFHPYDDLVQVVGQVGQASLQLDPQIFPNVAFDRIGVFLQNSNATNSSGSHTLSFWIGIYSRNNSSLSLVSSFSASTAVTHSGTAGSYSRYSGGRLFTFSVGAQTLTEGRYWLGFVSRTTSAGSNGSYSNYMVSNIASQFTGLFGTASNATMQPKLGQGFYTATTSGIPGSIAFSQINGTNSLARRFPVVGFHSGTV